MSANCHHLQQTPARSVFPITPKRIIATQLMVMTIATIISWLFYGHFVALSVFLGGIAVLLPNALFALVFLSRSRARSSSSILAVFYLGEAFKLLLSAGMALFFLVCFSLNIIALLIGVSLVSVSLILASLVPNQK